MQSFSVSLIYIFIGKTYMVCKLGKSDSDPKTVSSTVSDFITFEFMIMTGCIYVTKNIAAFWYDGL